MQSDDDIKDMVPDFVAGRLSKPDVDRVEAASAADPAIAAEIEFHRRLRAVVKDGEDGGTPGELGWARLARAIDADAQRKAGPPVGSIWRYAAVGFAALAGVQLVLLTTWSAGGPADPRYVPVAAGAADGALAAVAFVPSAREDEIRGLLREVGASIVDGPSALGLYTLRFETEAARRSGVERFVDEPRIVESAQQE